MYVMYELLFRQNIQKVEPRDIGDIVLLYTHKIHIYISFISQRVKPHFHSIFNTVLIGIFYISKLKSVLPLTMTQPNCQIPLAIFMKTFDRRNNKNQGWDCGKWRPAHELFSPSPAPRAQFSSLRTGERSGAFQSVHHR